MKAATKSAVEDVEDMHRGVHLALEALVNQKDKARAEEILRQLDSRMASWLNTTQVAR
jgi:hypothetical protein